jgi:hypothetical protein
LGLTELVGKHSLFAPKPPYQLHDWFPIRNKILNSVSTVGEINIDVAIDTRSDLLEIPGLSDANRELLDIASFVHNPNIKHNKSEPNSSRLRDKSDSLKEREPIACKDKETRSLSTWYRKFAKSGEKVHKTLSAVISPTTSPVVSPSASPVVSPSASPIASPRGLTGRPILGLPLFSLMQVQRASHPTLEIPTYLRHAIDRIRDCNGTKCEGIFRIAGNANILKACLAEGMYCCCSGCSGCSGGCWT